MAGLAAGLAPQAVFALSEPAELEARLAESGHLLADAPVYAVDRRVAAKLSTLESPAALMAVFPVPVPPALGELRSPRPAGAAARDASPSGLPAGGRHLIVYADRLADPGNLGTLVRAAAAFAAAALVASPGSVDLFSPKVVRAGMGAVFALPLYQDVPLARAVDELHAGPVYGLVAHDGRPLDEVAAAIADGPAGDPYAAGGAASTGPAASAGPAILVIGAERAGLSTDALACVTDLVTIPLAGATGGGVESLNAGVAGAIALYELSRPRRPQGARKE
ncbi:MAG TPA: RNA methyltransferase [Thermoleophilia bacterium]|nr:RNA methyltransferase [Thermoleophilia bacterium]